MNADGSGQVNLTNRPAYDAYPAWSPDGGTIAFESDGDIFTMSATGTNIKNVTNSPDAEGQPTWRDRGRISFVRNTLSGNKIFTIDRDGANLMPLYLDSYSPYTTNYYRPTFTNSGTRLFYLTDKDGKGFAAYFTDAYGFGDSFYNQTLIATDKVNSISGGKDTMSLPNRTFIGTSGLLGTGAAGFVFGIAGNNPTQPITSLVTFDTATTKRNFARVARLTAETSVTYNGNGGSPTYSTPYLVFTITAGDNNLTSLKYLNTSGPVTEVIGTANPSAGALVYFNSNSGEVTAIVPYGATKSVGNAPSLREENGAVVLQGHFTATFDANGKNIAPNGCREVRITNGVVTAK